MGSFTKTVNMWIKSPLIHRYWIYKVVFMSVRFIYNRQISVKGRTFFHMNKILLDASHVTGNRNTV